MATDADEKALDGDESGVKEGSGKGPEADSKTDSSKGSKDKELEKKYSEADVEAIFNRESGKGSGKPRNAINDIRSAICLSTSKSLNPYHF